jgi:protoheme ferro-lyase
MVLVLYREQSRVGPVEWLKPYTDVTIRELGKSGVKSLLAVPVRFVFCPVKYVFIFC